MRRERTTTKVVRFAFRGVRTNNYAGSAVGTNRVALQRNGIMLVLSRKKNESIVINNDITIVVVEIRGDKVRLGVEAPKEVPVHRREVYEAIKRNELAQKEAAKAATEPAAET
jgi:carbon storage regulator